MDVITGNFTNQKPRSGATSARGPGRAAGLCAALGLWLGWVGCHEVGPKGPAGPPPARVKLAALQVQPIEESANYLAEINSRRSVTLRAEVAGYVRTVFARAGDQLKQGTPILQIDPSREQATLATLQAAKTARRAALQNAQDQYNRASRLAPAGVVSQEQLTQATAALEAAKADLNAAESQIQAQQTQLGYFRVEAPFPGVVSDILVKVGDLLSPGTPITLINQSTALEADLQIPVLRASRLRPDSVIQLLDEQGKVVAQGKAGFVSPDVRSETQSVLVRTVFDNGPGLRFAERVPARIIWGTHPGLKVPTAAIVRRSGQTFVYVAATGEASKPVAQQRAVLLGDISGNEYEVMEGLKPGEQVVVSGVQKVVNGGPLQPEP